MVSKVSTLKQDKFTIPDPDPWTAKKLNMKKRMILIINTKKCFKEKNTNFGLIHWRKSMIKKPSMLKDMLEFSKIKKSFRKKKILKQRVSKRLL